MLIYTLRQATVKDLDLLAHIHAGNMQGYVEQVYPWNPTLFRDSFVSQDYQIIELKNSLIGFIKVVVTSEIYLAEIQIDRHYQNQGIGTRLITSIIKRSQLNNQQLWLKVIKGNPAERLYKRLGFIVFEETSTHKMMRLK
ncbi:MAG: GNAT family N-acetyltransferase [Pleurocapsa sp.]